MSKRKKEFFILDLYISIVKIEEYIKDKNSSQELLYDCKSWDAVIRELELVGESVKNLINYKIFDETKRNIVNFRNIITHHYFGIDEDIVWDILKNKLPQLKIETKEIIKSLPNKNEIVDYFIEDNKHFDFIVKPLKALKDE